MWEYDEQDALATAKVWADGGRADAVANMARAFVAMRRERDALLATMRALTREQAEIVAASVQNANALAAGYRDDCTRALTAQAMAVLAAVRKAPRFYPSQSTDGWFIMREEEDELPGAWVDADALLATLRGMLITNAKQVALGSRPTQTAEEL